MTVRENLYRRLAALVVIGWALSRPLLGQSEPEDDANFATLQADAKAVFRDKVTPFVKDYCSRCHGQDRQKGGINFGPALKSPGESASTERWKQAIAVVNSQKMPPENVTKQPTDEERQAFVNGVAKIKFLSSKDPGPFVIRRLTKLEYGNTLHDLFGVDPKVADELPDEVVGEGYLNTLSPLQSEQYLAIATEVLDRILPQSAAPGGRWGEAPAEPSKPSDLSTTFSPSASSTHSTNSISGNSPTEWQPRLLKLFRKAQIPGADEREAARTVARSLARSAYRRPASDAELDTLVAVFDLARDHQRNYQDALRLMLKAVLVSPQFLYITPVADAEPAGSIVPLDDYQLASRLSYLLWATMPDPELSALADQGTLREPAVLKAQVKRLLMDPRSRALFDGFGAQWLGLGSLATKTFDRAKFPQMTAEMRSAMYEEARLFFESIVRENRSLITFVDGDYTYLNGTLATVYGLGIDVTGPSWREVKLTNPNRGGILGMPGVLATTSFPNRTSPVKRGVWVLEQVLGEHVPPPPPNVPALDKQDHEKVANLTLRQRTELHRTEAVCANCHKILDPIGFGLENFDAIGRWRELDDTGGAIDAGGELPDGKHFASPKELKAILAARTDDIARNLAGKLLAYALCRQLEGYDEIILDRLVQTLAKDGYRMQTLITEIVTSYPFTHRRIRQEQLSVSANEK